MANVHFSVASSQSRRSTHGRSEPLAGGAYFSGKQSLGEHLWITATAPHVPTIVKKPKTDYNQPDQDKKTSYLNDLVSPQITGLKHRQIHYNTLERNLKEFSAKYGALLLGMPTSIFCL